MLRLKSLRLALILTGALPLTANAVNAPLTIDSYVSSSFATSNFGTAQSLKINSTSKTLLRFDLSALPSGTADTDVAKATLFVWVGTVTTAGAVQVSPALATWSETGVSSSNAPTTGAPYATNVTVASPAGYYLAVDVTNAVKDWLLAPASNFGLVLEPDSSATTTAIFVDSKESQTTSHAAYLEIAMTKTAAGSGGVTQVTGSAPLSVATGTTTPAISIAQASGSTNGFLSSGDWTTFNNKGSGTVTNVTGGGPISVATGTTTPAISITQANGTTNGFLSSTDWTSFNNKGTVTNVTGGGPISVATGTTTPAISITQAGTASNGYLSSTDWNTFNNKGNGTVTSITAGAGLSGGTITGSGTISLANPVTANLTGNATTASSLEANGSNCSAGQYPLGVDAAGNVENCTTASGGGVTTVTAATPLASTGGTTPQISLANSGVTAGSYTSANITVDATGRVTSAANGSAGGGVTPVYVTSSPAVAANVQTNLFITCPSGKPISGGYNTDNATAGYFPPYVSCPATNSTTCATTNPTGWRVQVWANAATNIPIYVVCL